MDTHLIFLILFYAVESKRAGQEKIDFCRKLNCGEWPHLEVCGIREEFKGFRLRLFESECQLLKYGCSVDENKTYGIINLEYCEKAFIKDTHKSFDLTNEIIEKPYTENIECARFNCPLTNNKTNICGITKHGVGYKIRLFFNECELMRHNCETNATFVETDLFICNSIMINDSITIKEGETEDVPPDEVIKNIVIVDTNMLGHNNDINETIETFFAATHVLDLPMREVPLDLVNEITRRRQIKIAGPIKVFQPWTTIPSNISDDYMHSPTLSSCYHKCPMKCPDTYAPVCGVPGIVAREPSLMFQNHCFMDVAQCKMRWEDKSATAISSSYIESSFMFCLGDQLNAMYRFLPLVRTLQHMGRLKKKGRFRYKLRNMRFFNSLLSRDPNLMG